MWRSSVWASCVMTSCVCVCAYVEFCVSKLCESNLCASKLCDDKLCVSKLYDDKLCVSNLFDDKCEQFVWWQVVGKASVDVKLCEDKLCVCMWRSSVWASCVMTSCVWTVVGNVLGWDGRGQETTGGGGGGRDTEPKTRTPHKDVGKNSSKPPSSFSLIRLEIGQQLEETSWPSELLITYDSMIQVAFPWVSNIHVCWRLDLQTAQLVAEPAVDLQVIPGNHHSLEVGTSWTSSLGEPSRYVTG